MAAREASNDAPPRQRRAIRADARTSDQNPAAAVRAISLRVFRFTDLIGCGTPSPAYLSLELAI
jgi:hypothetical protein